MIASTGAIGTVSASNSELDWSEALAPDPRIEGATVEVAELDGSMGDLDYVDNDGATRSLTEWGLRLRSEAPSGEEDDPNNPVSLRADNIDAATYTDYPRGVEDDDEEPVSALDAANWDDAGGLTATDSGSSIQFSGDAGDSAMLDLSAIDGVIDSGIERRMLQTVVNVSDVTDGMDVEISDGTNSITERIAETVEHGVVTQTQVGDLDGSGDLDSISEITITAVGGALDAELVGLDVERESKLTFGSQEEIETDEDGDEELVVNDVEEPSGWFEITSLETRGTNLDGAVDDVRFDIEGVAEQLSPDQVAVEFSDAPASRSASRQMDLAVEYQIPSGFDLDWISVGSLEDTASFPSGNYLGVELLEDAEISEIEDPFDLGDDAVELGEEFDMGEEIDISGQAGVDPAPGVGSILHYSVLLSDDQEDMLMGSGGGWFGAGGGSSDDGGLSGTLRGFVVMIAAIGGGAVAWLRSRGRTLGIGGS